MPLILYGTPLSPYTRAAAVTCIERGVDYKLEVITPADLQIPDYSEKHPFRKIPALHTGQGRVYETGAIVRYIDAIGEAGPRLQPSDLLARAYSDQWMSTTVSYLYAHAFNNFAFMRTLAPAFDISVDEERLADSKERTQGFLSIVGAAVEAGELGAEQPHLGDIVTGVVLAPLRSFDEGVEIMGAHPTVDRWLATLENRESFEKTRASIS
ncbi:MAG: glutathione S-transferase family protein [Pseudomonadota bacterium]